MNIVILSGGSGNDSLVKGLKSLYPDCSIKILLNAYDSGKSTGICRKVTNTLGVSDIRKNHIRLYKKMAPFVDQKIVEFYEKRYDLQKGNEKETVKEYLKLWNMYDLFSDAADYFFALPDADKYDYNDFNISNIIYSSLYASKGYEKTNSIFETLLDLTDHVLLNSFDNVALKAITKSGYVIEDEGELVEYCNADNPIVSLDLVDFIHGDKIEYPQINCNAIDAVMEADYIIFSAGTFWSSIFPTIMYGDFFQHLNRSKAKKIWVMNNTQDKDAWGVSNLDFISYIKNVIDLREVAVLINSDADESLRLPMEKGSIIASLGNDHGKHDGEKLAEICMKYYFGLTDKYDQFIFDFDDTIFSRMWNKDEKLHELSVENCKLISELSKKYNMMIVSGNDYVSIYNKISSVFGSSLDDFDIPIWANANAVKYVSNKVTDINASYQVDKQEKVVEILKKLKIDNIIMRGEDDITTSISIKPLDDKYRILLVEYLNEVFPKLGIANRAYATGWTTVDILNKKNNKTIVFEYSPELYKRKTYYVGDEVDSGNDKEIANLCDYRLHVKSIGETNSFLKLLKKM